MQPLFARHSASISELKRNPTALIEQACGEPIVILNHNTPSAYLIPTETYERMMDLLDDLELGQLLEQRMNDGQKPIRVSLDDL